MTRSTPLQRFWANITIDPVTGCWLWTGSTQDGYGTMYAQGKTMLASRFAYEHFVGPVPPGHEPDHLCRVRPCANPGHLEVVTKRENVLRGVGPTAENARKDRCPQGHAYTYYACDRGRRRCRECHCAKARARYAAARRAA